jgi:hypothetical protein
MAAQEAVFLLAAASIWLNRESQRLTIVQPSAQDDPNPVGIAGP